MVTQMMSRIARWIYPSQFEMVPGQFESFLTGVATLPVRPATTDVGEGAPSIRVGCSAPRQATPARAA